MATGAVAQSCNASITDINFGTVSLRAGAVNQTSGSVTVQCSGGVLSAIAKPLGICLTFGGGSASDGGSPPRRYMTGPQASLLEYQLRPSGNGNTGGTLSQIYVPVLMLLGQGSATVPIYADILTSSVALPTGSYQASYSGVGNAGVRMRVGVLSCDLLATEQAVSGFMVRADVASSCEVSTTAMDFGNIGATLGQPVDQTAQVQVRCTSGTPYRVSLGLGTGPGVTSPAARKMRSGLSSLVYGLFQDAGRSLPWGDTIATNLGGTGAGATQIYTVFGRIFAGQTASVGSYSDQVVVTIAY